MREALWVFLDVPDVDSTNNMAASEKGQRWVERVLSLRYPCRIRGQPTFPILVEAVACLFTGEKPDLSWIIHHEAQPASSPL